MPSIRIWTAEEQAAFAAKKNGASNGNARKELEAVFDQLIADVSVGLYATITLSDGENKPTTRNRLKSAATRRNLDIVFHRTKDDTVVFHLEEQEAQS